MRKRLKSLLGHIYRLNSRVEKAIDRGLTVFVFHDVTNSPSEFSRRYGLWVSTETFEKQILWIQKNFNVVSPVALLAEGSLPKRAAVITFDDGFQGTFDNGLRILNKLGVPSIVFLNMAPIIHRVPLLSAAATYLGEKSSTFSDFCNASGLSRPYHLTLTPTAWAAYLENHGPFDIEAILQYQGEFADLQTLQAWDATPLVHFGNHLFDHWNAAALTDSEFIAQFQQNETALRHLRTNINIFAFTNGKPSVCFSQKELELLKDLGVKKVFSTAGGVNQNHAKFLLGRVPLCEIDGVSGGLWFRISRAIKRDSEAI
jgi:peptidoglycan/xylan/chitin deacetylase (PgdA/CDA1 family)